MPVLTRAAGSWWVRLLISVAILAYLATQIDMAAAGRAVITINPRHLVLVLVLVGIDRMVMILRWVLLLRASHAPVSAREAASIFLMSSFVGSFLPAGIGGDAARAWSLTRVTDRGSEALASVAVDRLLGVLSLLAMAIVGASIWSSTRGLDGTNVMAVSPGRSAIAVALIILVSVAAFWSDRLVRLVTPTGLHDGALGGRVLRISDAVSRFRGTRLVLAHVMVWSLVVQVLRIVQAYFLGLGLGLEVPFEYYLVFMPIGLLMLLLPISISGFGLPQGVIVWLLRPLGVPEEQAFALTTLIVLTGLAGNLPGLVIWLRERREIQ